MVNLCLLDIQTALREEATTLTKEKTTKASMVTLEDVSAKPKVALHKWVC